MAVDYIYEDDGNTIKQTRTATAPDTPNVSITKYNKRNTSITVGVTKDLLEISDLRGSASVEYSDISLPVSANITDLCDQLNVMLTDVKVSVSISPPVGAATEAKQDDQIVEAEETNETLDEILAALDGSGEGKTLEDIFVAINKVQACQQAQIDQQIETNKLLKLILS